MTTSEEQLIQVLCEVLGMDPGEIAPQTEFVELGLDSITGLRFARRAQDKLGLNIELEWLFDYPSVARLAVFLDAHRASACEGPGS